MALIFERELITHGQHKIIAERLNLEEKIDDAERVAEPSIILDYNVAIPLSHIPRSSEQLFDKGSLKTSRRFPSEYVLPVLVSITHDESFMVSKYSDTPVIVATYSHNALGRFRPFEDKPGIPFAIFEKDQQEFIGRLIEESAYYDPPIRFGNHVFRRSQLYSNA